CMHKWPDSVRCPGPVMNKKGRKLFAVPSLSLPFKKWIQLVMEGPFRASPITGLGSAAVGRALTGLISIRRLMFPMIMTIPTSL
ncbi:MAG TPA: hypothetical protein VMB77_14345, partial [Syntrophales bacterium]|nr:hypothetical protein [Syntrophales bacterium]